MDKGKLYRIIEGITPPYILRALKRTSLYSYASRNASSFTASPVAKEVAVTGGDMEGVILKFNPDGVWQQEMLSGHYDEELFSYLHARNLTGKTIYDIGAHIGFHSLAFAKYVGTTGHVYAFEPNPVNLVRLQEIVQLNPSLVPAISIRSEALSDSAGTTTFLCSNELEGGASTGGFVTDATTIWERSIYVDKIAFKEITVPTDTIDGLVAKKAILPPDVLKIDVEGAEQLVLKGALKTLSEYKPIIIVEFHSINSAYECMLHLTSVGYKTVVLKREGDGRVMIAATAD